MASAFFKQPVQQLKEPGFNAEGASKQQGAQQPHAQFVSYSASPEGLSGQRSESRGMHSMHAASEGRHSLHAAYGGVSGAHTLTRNWRFPSSQKYLWDRTASGRMEYINPKVG